MNSRFLPLLITAGVFVAAFALASLQFPAILSTRVVANLLTDNAYLGVVAVGMTFVILSGGIDLSVGSVIAFTGVFIAVLVREGYHPYPVIAAILVLAALFGALMGAMIHALRTPPFIVTLAGMFLARGGCYLLTTESVPINHPAFEALKDVTWRIPSGGRFTFVAMVMLLVFALGMLLAHKTRFGTYVYALGGDRTAAELMGVPVGRVTVGIYALSSFLAGVAGVVFALYTSSGYSLATVGVELDAIAAVVIGGTLLTGGVGFVGGTLIGVLISGLIQTYIVFDGTLSSWWTKIAIGVLLFLFIVLQRGLTRRSAIA